MLYITSIKITINKIQTILTKIYKIIDKNTLLIILKIYNVSPFNLINQYKTHTQNTKDDPCFKL